MINCYSSYVTSLVRQKPPCLTKVALLGHFNGQGLGVSVQDFVSKHLVVDPNTGGVAQQAGGVATESDASSPTSPERPHSLRNCGTSDADVSDDIQVLVRTTPGVEYVKASDGQNGDLIWQGFGGGWIIAALFLRTSSAVLVTVVVATLASTGVSCNASVSAQVFSASHVSASARLEVREDFPSGTRSSSRQCAPVE